MGTLLRPSLCLGYFGRAGSFSHLAAGRRFPKADLRECPTMEEAFARLQSGEFSHILVPIENAPGTPRTPDEQCGDEWEKRPQRRNGATTDA